MTSKNEHGPDEALPAKSAAGDSDYAPLRAILAALEGEDQAAYETLSRENPQLFTVLPDGGFGAEAIAQIRQALRQEDCATPDVGFSKLAAKTIARLTQMREEAAQRGMPAETDRGVLTDVTRTLTPEMAAALYRKIAPLIVFEILRKLDRSARLDTVHAVTDHLCAGDVLQRLQQCPHASDAIVDELCVCLGDVGLKKELDRASMLEVMEACGVLGDLEAMANCLLLGKTRAG